MAFRHVVLFRLNDGVSSARIDDAIDQLEGLGTLPGVVSMVIARSLDGRKGRIIVEDATFIDAAAFSAFRASPRHTAVGSQMAEISDWWIGDYES